MKHLSHRWLGTAEGTLALAAILGTAAVVPAAVVEPEQAYAETGKLPAADAPFDQAVGYFIWPYQFGYQNVSKANPKGTVPGTDKPATAPAAGEYGWAAPGYRDYDACMASLDAQIAEVKESGMKYVTVSYLISPLNAKQKADGSWGDPSKQGDVEPDTRLNDAIINRVLDAGLTPMIYFSQGNPDKRLGDNPVAAFTMDQIHATIEHAVKTFAGRGVIWESWNEPDSAGWTSGMTAENKPHWIALDQFIGDCVDKYDKGADYVYGNFASPGNNNAVSDDVLAKAHATARSGHGYGGGTPEAGTKPNLNTSMSAYVDSEFGVPSSGRIRWAANSWGDWGDKDDAHPEEGYLATEQNPASQAAWLTRQLLMKDISGINLSTIYRLVGYDSFSVNDNADGANPSKITVSPAYEQIKALVNELKGYTFQYLLPVNGHEYDGTPDGRDTNFKSDADTKNPATARVYAALYQNGSGQQKLVYWMGGRTGANAKDNKWVVDPSAIKQVKATFNGQQLQLTAGTSPKVATISAASVSVSTQKGVAPALPATVQVTGIDGKQVSSPVIWDKVDASLYKQSGTFTVKGAATAALAAGVPVYAHVMVKAVASGTATATTFQNTTAWKDTAGEVIQAHGGSIAYSNGTYYWVGQGAPDNVPTGYTGAGGVFVNQWLFTTINMYTSKDLVNWTPANPVASIDSAEAYKYAEGNVEGSTSKVLSYVNADGTAAKGFEQLLKEHPQYARDAALGCKIERPHILFNKNTNKWVVWAHWEGTVGYGSSELICFESENSDPTSAWHVVSWGKDAQGNDIYHARPTVTIDGKQTSVVSRDLTAWVDPDTGKGYVISVNDSGLRLYKLDDTYTKIEPAGSYEFMQGQHVEAPSMFKSNGRFYMFTSRQDYWDPTQTEYATAANIEDPSTWSGLTEVQSRGEARKNWGNQDPTTRTYLGQPTYALQYNGKDYMPHVLLMSDDWNPLRSKTANVDTTKANYVWSSVDVDDETGAANVDYHQVVNPMKPAENGTLSGFSYEYRKDAGNYPETFVGAGYYITGYTGSAANVTLPATINGKPVVGALLDQDAQNGKLTGIDTSKATDLGIFRVSAAYQVKSLDFTANKKLQKLDVSDTSTPASALSSVKLGGLAELTNVDLGFHENLKALDVSGSPKLAHLDVSNTGITSLDLTKNPLLKREAGNVSADNDVTIDFDETRTVTFESNGGSVVAAVKVADGKAVAKPADPKRAGYTFAGWFSDRALTKAYDFGSAVKADVTLYAKWTKNPAPQPKVYTVAFDANGGSAVASQKVADGKAAAKPADPSRAGYTFAGWFSDQALTKAYDFGSAVKADTTLYAKWTQAPKPSEQFKDVTGASHWVKDEGYLDYSVEHGLMTGYKNEATQQLNGLFGPTDKITRGQVAVVLFRIANPTDDSTTNPAHYGPTTGFSDQGAFPYYKSAIKWLKDKGVLTGDKDPVTQADLNTVRPDAPITRQELATMVARFASNVKGVDVSHADVSQLGKFTDGKQVMPFAQKAMAWCYQAGVFTGGQAADAGKLMPLNNTQRDQACKVFTVLHRDVLKLK